MIRIGDVFEIPLKQQRKAYGQYVYKDKKQGPLIQVKDLLLHNINFTVDQFCYAKPLFPPVITGLSFAISSKLWTRVGNAPVIDWSYPKFITADYDFRSGKVYRWFLWNGNLYTEIGLKLPDDYKSLEYLVVWSPFDVVERIETGQYPYPYGDMIRHNQFKPINKE